MTPSSWITQKAAKGVGSAIAGRGLIATAAIGKDEVVAVKGGHIVSTATLRSLSDRLQNSDIQITDDLHLAALADDEYEPVMLFINHSCDPNVGFAGNIVLVAMRDIQPGEELTTDYALFDDYDGSMPCQCGTPHCRGVITGHDWQNQDLQRKYRGYFSWYLQRRIPDSETRELSFRPSAARPRRYRPARRQPRRDRGHGGERDGDRDPLQDARAGGRGVRQEHRQGGGRRGSAGQQVAAPGPPGADRAEAARQEQLRDDQIQVEDQADDVVRLVVPGGRAAGELHVVAAEQPGGHGERTGDLDEPRRRAAHFLGELLAEPDRAAAEHQEAGDHDRGVAGVRRREAAELNAERAVPSLAQRPAGPRDGEHYWPGHAGQRANQAGAALTAG
jgi:uncharacterized protein